MASSVTAVSYGAAVDVCGHTVETASEFNQINRLISSTGTLAERE